MIAQAELRELITWKVLAVAAVYVLAVISTFAWILPNYQKIQLLNGELEREYIFHSSLERIIDRRSSLEKEKSELEAAVARLENVIPTAEDLPLILEYLREIAEVWGTQMDDVSFVPHKGSGLEEEILLNASLTGQYGEIWNFVYSLQDTLPTLAVTKMTVEPHREQVLQADMSFRIKLRPDVMMNEWSKPTLDGYYRTVSAHLWGLPSTVLTEFWSEKTAVLGIVRTEREARALIKRGDQQKWVRPGDQIGPSVVEAIEPKAVILQLNGIKLRLKMGG